MLGLGHMAANCISFVRILIGVIIGAPTAIVSWWIYVWIFKAGFVPWWFIGATCTPPNPEHYCYQMAANITLSFFYLLAGVGAISIFSGCIETCYKFKRQ